MVLSDYNVPGGELPYTGFDLTAPLIGLAVILLLLAVVFVFSLAAAAARGDRINGRRGE